MKKMFLQPGRTILAMGAVALLPLTSALAGDPADAPSTPAPVVVTPPPASEPATPAKLPYGCEDVVKLSRANISEDIVLNYVRNSGTIYNLGSADIVALKNNGVSDKVINAMLDKRKQTAEIAAQSMTQPAPQALPQPSTPAPDANAAYAAPNAPPIDQGYVQPAPSTVYVAPYAPAAPYYYSPYYYPYYGYGYGPAVSFGFRFGGGWRGGWGHGGWGHGGFHHR